jgi:hypothetical protein
MKLERQRFQKNNQRYNIGDWDRLLYVTVWREIGGEYILN